MRNVLNSPRLSELKKGRQKVFLKKILLFLFVLIAIFIGLMYISKISRLNINKVEVTGNKVIDTEIIKIAVEKEILGNYLWVFPKTNIFLYPKNKIKEELNNELKRLKEVTIVIKDKQMLEIKVSEREPKYTWCGGNMETENKEICYFLDDTGFIFDEAPYFSGEVYFKFYGQASYGSYFLPESFAKLILFKKTLEDIELKPVALYKMQNEEIKVLLSSSSVNPEIILKADADFEKVAENLQAAFTTEPFKTDFKKKYATLSYIDLRFGNKVYYKFR